MAKPNAAVKIRLGARPKTFKKTVEFDMLEGGRGCIEVTYTYRTKSEFGEFADERQAEMVAAGEAKVAEIEKASAEGREIPEFKQSDAVKAQAQFSINYVMSCVENWNLDVPFDREAVEQMIDELPAAVAAIINTYRDAIMEGRLGN